MYEENSVDWAIGEAFGYGSLLLEGQSAFQSLQLLVLEKLRAVMELFRT